MAVKYLVALGPSFVHPAAALRKDQILEPVE